MPMLRASIVAVLGVAVGFTLAVAGPALGASSPGSDAASTNARVSTTTGVAFTTSAASTRVGAVRSCDAARDSLRASTPADSLRLAAKAGSRVDGTLSERIARTFKGGQYTTRTLDEDLILYRRWGDEAGQLGPYWSRTNYVRAGNARRYSPLPPGNTAEHVTTIRVPAGTRIHEGRSAAHADWGAPGGGSQVVFDEGFRVPRSWVQP